METKTQVLEGQEVWTNAFGDRFGERVCVGIEGGRCVHEGKWFTPTAKEKKQLWDDFVTQEFGSKEQIARDLEEEFGFLTKGTPEQNREAFKKEFGCYPKEN